MGKYVDGFVLRVPKNKLKEYKKMSSAAGKLWKKHGALEYFECVGDDLAPDMQGVKALTFPKLTKAKPSEAILFSFIVYKSKAHRNSVNKKVMTEMNEEYNDKEMPEMPFDVKKMAYAGFKPIVEF